MEDNNDLRKKLDTMLVGKMVESIRGAKVGRDVGEQEAVGAEATEVEMESVWTKMGEKKGEQGERKGIYGNWRTKQDEVKGEGDWMTVRRGGKGQSVDKPMFETENRFTLLEDSDGDDQQSAYTVVGDSIVKYFKDNCYRSRKRVKRTVRSSPGAGLERIVEHLDSEEADGDTVVIHAGTNDVSRVGSEKLFALFKTAINKVRNKGKKCIISSIIPRRYESRYWLSRAIGQNNRIKQLCKEMDDCFFVDTWFDFWQKDELFSRDGVHLSSKGERFLSNRLDEAVVHLSNFQEHLSIRNKR